MVEEHKPPPNDASKSNAQDADRYHDLKCVSRTETTAPLKPKYFCFQHGTYSTGCCTTPMCLTTYLHEAPLLLIFVFVIFRLYLQLKQIQLVSPFSGKVSPVLLPLLVAHRLLCGARFFSHLFVASQLSINSCLLAGSLLSLSCLLRSANASAAVIWCCMKLRHGTRATRARSSISLFDRERKARAK